MQKITLFCSFLLILFACGAVWPATTYYEVWRNTVNDSSSATRIRSWIESTSYDDPNVVPGQTYYYWIKVITAETKHGVHQFIAGDFAGLGTDIWLTCPTAARRGYASPIKVKLRIAPGYGLTVTQIDNSLLAYHWVWYPPWDQYDIMDEWPCAGPIYLLESQIWEKEWTRNVVISNYETDNTAELYTESTIHITNGSSSTSYAIKSGMELDPIDPGPHPLNVILRDYFDSAPTGVTSSQGTYTDKIHISWDAVTGNSDFSDEAAQGWLVLPPPVPTGVYASKGDFSDKVRVMWNNLSEASEYRIYRNTTNDSGPAQLIGTNSGSLNNLYDDSNAVSSSVYWYWVKAVNVSGMSSSLSSPDYGYRIALEGDFNGDRKVDFHDLTILTNQWLQLPGNPSADIAPPPNGDGIVNFFDFALFAQHWLEGVVLIPTDMVLIPAGYFAYQGNYTPQTFVNSFQIDKYEVTNDFYCQYLNNADPTGAHYDTNMEIDRWGASGSYYYTLKTGKEQYPIRYVSAYDAEAFAAWRSATYGGSYRLPTEQEWEKAAGWNPASQYLYTYGFQQDTIDCTWCNYTLACYGGPLPVGSFNGTGGKKDAKSYYGCYDMSGNVWEWTSSMYDGYDRVIRGGDWNYAETGCATTIRDSHTPPDRNTHIGFRLALDL